jgi:hypothetical protein
LSDLPPIVQRFLEKPGAILHGSFNYLTEDSARLVEMRKKTPKGHLTVELDNWPEKPRIWYVGSEPCEMGKYPGAIKSVIPEEPYPTGG